MSVQEIKNAAENAVLEGLKEGMYEIKGKDRSDLVLASLEKVDTLKNVKDINVKELKEKGIDVAKAEVYQMSADTFKMMTKDDKAAFKDDPQFAPIWYKSSAQKEPMDVGFYFVRWMDKAGKAHYCDLSSVISPKKMNDYSAYVYLTGGTDAITAPAVKNVLDDPNALGVTDLAVAKKGSHPENSLTQEVYMTKDDAVKLIEEGWAAHIMEDGIVYYNRME